jgi:hypothetical protein
LLNAILQALHPRDLGVFAEEPGCAGTLVSIQVLLDQIDRFQRADGGI